MESEQIISIRRGLRWVITLSLVAGTGLLIVAVALKPLDDVRAHILNTFVALLVGALLADVHLREFRKSPKWVVAGIITIVISQVCFLLWIWTGWATESLLYRLWWVSLAPAVSSAHILMLQNAVAGQRDLIARGTPICVVALGLMLTGLGLHRDVPPQPGPAYTWLTALLAVGMLFGSFVIWRRWRRRRAQPVAMSRGGTIAWLCVSHLLLLSMGLYIGRRSAPAPSPFDTLPSALAGLSSEQIDAQVHEDLELLKTIAAGVSDLTRRAAQLDLELTQKLTDEKRTLYFPEEEDLIRSQFMSYLSYRAALLRLVATYAGFGVVRDPELRARCFMVGYAAAMTTFRASLQLVTTYRDKPLARRKLNEPEEKWGIPAGMFDRIYESVANDRNIEFAAEMAAHLDLKRAKWRVTQVWPPADFNWLEGRILDGIAYVRAHRINRHEVAVGLFLERVKKDAYTPMYAAQSMLAEWIGDTRIVERPPFISIDQIQGIESKLRPGDILLERRNWCLSNAFLPGFWPHAALYVGRIADLRRLGIADEPAVQKHMEEFLEPASDGQDHTVIESVSEGVIFNSLTHSMNADYVAVLRPRLSEAQIAQAIVRAFRHKGKPYDFEFDFFTADKLVCTELVYRAYEGMLHFDLVRVMGRDTLPALEIVRKFANERHLPDHELEFVLFLDAVPESGRAELVSEEELCNSADRPRAFNE